jgi:hypothetical protein
METIHERIGRNVMARGEVISVVFFGDQGKEE